MPTLHPRLVRIRHQGKIVWGLLEKETVYRLESSPYVEINPGKALGPLAEFTLLPPATPSKIVCVGRNFLEHALEHGSTLPSDPLLFLKPPSSVIGPGEVIELPWQSRRVEHEAELALVVGKRCRDVTPEEAWDCVLGVTCANDVTARDLQRRDVQWTRGKGFDTFCPLGPWLVTGLMEDTIAAKAILCRVNGEVRQKGYIGDMAFSPSELLAYATGIMTMEAGDVLLTGTPAGVGPLTPGDVVEVEIEGLGVLRNSVA